MTNEQIKKLVSEIMGPVSPEDLAEWDAAAPSTLVEEVAENMATYASSVDSDESIPEAKLWVYGFQKANGRLPNDYVELEAWSLSLPRSGHS